MQRQQHCVLDGQQSTCGKRKLLAMITSVTSVIGLSMVLYGTQPGRADAQMLSEQAAQGAAQSQRQLSAKLMQDSPPAIELASLKQKYQRPDAIPFPEDNGPSQARELLGRTLFFDPRLSGSNWIACATCHNPALAWGDGLPRAIGHGMQVLGRRTPTILNLAWAEEMSTSSSRGSGTWAKPPRTK